MPKSNSHFRGGKHWKSARKVNVAWWQVLRYAFGR